MPSPVLVTGASGFLGWHVASLLRERGHAVRALARRPDSIRELDVEIFPGDLRDPASLERAVQGCAQVFHVAADYRLWVRDKNELFASNVQGTRNLLEAARRAGVERFVYTSTVGCIGFIPGGVAGESSSVSPEQMIGAYKRSKWDAEQAAFEYARQGFPVVIVNPTAPVGDHDWKPTPTGQTIVDFLRRAMPAYIDTGLNVVDARDVALGHLLAAERGSPGARYILGSENLTLRQIFGILSSIAGLPAPKVRLPWLVAAAAGACSTALSQITGRPPRVAWDAVRMARKKMWVTHAKAARDLGYQPAPAETGLRKAVDWFRANGYC
jgi:dihydroflavonol-4-reductase